MTPITRALSPTLIAVATALVSIGWPAARAVQASSAAQPSPLTPTPTLPSLTSLPTFAPAHWSAPGQSSSAAQVFPLSTAAPAAAGSVLDQQQLLLGTTGSSVGGYYEQKLAQIVTTGIAGLLTEVKAPLVCTPDATVVMEIQGVATGGPSGVLLATQSYPGSSFPSSAWGTFGSLPLATPLSFSTGSQFAIVLDSRPWDALETGCSIVTAADGETYPRGNAYFDSRPNPAGQWVCMCIFSSAWDLAFQTFVVPSGGSTPTSTPGPSPTGTPTRTPTRTPTPMPTAAPTGGWSATGSMATPRRDHTATLLADGRVLIQGWDWSASRAEIYNPSTGTFSLTGRSVVGHGQGSTATRLADGRVLIVGGNGSPSSAEIYDPVTGTFAATGSTNAPHAFHTATLLTNGRVLVAGLNEIGGSTAELYDPGTGTFTLTGSLSGQRDGAASALLPDGRVLVAGGTRITSPGYGICLDSAEVYDPVAGTFSPTGNMTAARCSLSWSDAPLLSTGKVLIIGGSVAAAELFDPLTGTFSATGSMSTGRGVPSVTRLANGQVLVAGGFTDVGPATANTAELYNPATGAFQVTSSMSINRQQHTATLLANGQVLVTGGYTGATETAAAELFTPSAAVPTLTPTTTRTPTATLTPTRTPTTTSTPGPTFTQSPSPTANQAITSTPTPTPTRTSTPTRTFTPTLTISPTVTRTPRPTPVPLRWSPRAGMPTARFGLGLAAPAAGGRIYAIGGYSYSQGTTLGSLEEYDPIGNTWTVRSNMPTARWGAGVAAASNGKVYAAGGNGGNGPLFRLEEYDPATSAWRQRANMPSARSGLALAAASSGKLYAIGGLDLFLQPVSFVEEYDPASDRWTSKARLPTARAYLAVVGAANGKLYAIGGYNPSRGFDLNTVEEYDPATDTWATRASLPTARQRLGAAQASSGKIYAIGGYSSFDGSYLGVVEEYDPATDTWTSQTSMPTPRGELAVALGPDGRLYAIGGSSAAAGGASIQSNGVRGSAIGEVNAVEAASFAFPQAPGNGLLRVYSDPAVATTIKVDGVARNDWGLDWIELPGGDYYLSFGEVAGFSNPTTLSVKRCSPGCGTAADQSVYLPITVRAGETTEVRAPFTASGFLRVTTEGYGTASPTISIDGQPANEWGLWVAQPAGSYTVSFEDVGSPSLHPCSQTVAVSAGATTHVHGNYSSGSCAVVVGSGRATAAPPSKSGATSAANGLLRVYSDPAVATTIRVDGVARNDWGLDWLELPAGDYTLSFRGVGGFATPTSLSVKRCNPGCGAATDQAATTTVTVRAGETTEVRAAFTNSGFLRVTTEGYGSASPTISINGNPANEWGAWVALPAGTYAVSFESLSGLTQPCSQSAPVAAGATTHVHGNYSAGSCAIVM